MKFTDCLALVIILQLLAACVGNKASLLPERRESRLPETIEAAGHVIGGAYDRLFGAAKRESSKQ